MIHWMGQVFKDGNRVGQLWCLGNYQYRLEVEIKSRFYDNHSLEDVLADLVKEGYVFKPC